MLAEGILKKDKRAATLAPLPLQPVYERPWTALTGRPPSVDEMAICVADVDPAGIMAVLATLPQSREERGAFSGLSEAMGKCLQNGIELSADPLALRTEIGRPSCRERVYPYVSISVVAVTIKKQKQR